MDGKIYTLEDIVNKVSPSKNQPAKDSKPQFEFIPNEQMRFKTDAGLQAASFTVPKSAIYDRLSDGSYVPRFENYMGAEGNEDRLAQSQGFFEKAGSGLGKFIVKTGSYAVDATLGTAYGIMNGIGEGSWSAVWDNDFSKSMDDFNKRVDSKLVNYYTDEEKSNGLLAAIPGFGATNFWFNDVAGGMAFVAGALLPELAIGALSGGTSLGVGAAKTIAKASSKSALKAGVKEVAEETTESALKGFMNPLKNNAAFRAYEKGTDVVRNYNRLALGKTAGDIVSTTAFLARTSNFEAGMEARHNFKTATEEFFSTFEEKNGRPPTYEEMSDFLISAKSSANGVYAANMGILAISNAVMFGKKFNIGQNLSKKLDNVGNSIIGLGTKVEAGAKTIMKESTKFQRGLGKTYKILGKPAVEGLYEEGFQGVAGGTMQNYLNAKYDPKVESGYDMWASLTDAFAEQYGTAEGWKEMGIGFIIGSAGSTMQGGPIAGFGKDSYKATKERIEKGVNESNLGQDTLIKRVNTATTLANFGNQKKSGSGEVKLTDIDNAFVNVEYIKSQEQVKSHKEMVADFDAIVDNMEISDSQIDELGGEQNVSSYKQSLKEEFNRNLGDYKFARKVVNSLGLDRKLKDTPGTISEIGDYVTMSIVAGKESISAAKNIASQIDTLIGSDGIFNYMEHYNNLSENKRGSIQELKDKQARLDILRKSATTLALDIAGIQSATDKQIAPETKQRVYNKTAEKYAAMTQQIASLETEITSITEGLNSDLRAENFSIDNVSTTDGSTHDILKTVEELDKLDKFVDSLRAVGKNDAADSIEYLVDQYKQYSDSHREMNNTIRKMIDTDFFSSKKGSKLKNTIVGSRYKMSDEFKNIIKENDELIDKSLKLVGVRGEATVEETITKYLGENPNLSDREKYRIESLIRMQLGYERLKSRVQDIESSTQIIESSEQGSTSPLEGDTVTLRQRLENIYEGKSNLDVLNEVIGEIISEIDAFKNIRLNNTEDAVTEELGALDETEYNNFVDNGKVSTERLRDIANKVKNKEDLLEKENAIFTSKTAEINELLEQIKEEETQTDSNFNRKGKFRLVETEDYKRFVELTKKKESAELTDGELRELQDITEDIDQWTLISGTVVDGIRLSDLVKQKIALENIQVNTVENIPEVTSQETLNASELSDKASGSNQTIAQTYEAVTAVRVGQGKVEISGISPEELIQEVGFEFEYTVDDQNNIIIEDIEGQEESIIARINQDSPISILPTNRNLTTNYSVVLKTEPVIGGGTKTTALKSTHTKDFDKKMTPDAIYNMEVGEGVKFTISPKDKWNIALLKKYRNAKTEKGKTEALKEIAKSLVVKVLDKDGNFVAVIKAQRKNGTKSIDNLKFEALRDQLSKDEDLIEQLANVNMNQELDIDSVTVKKVYLGHPNFNFSKDADGSVSIQFRKITEQDAKLVDDFGFVENGKVTTRTQRGDIDMTFLNKIVEKNPNTRIPIVVINKGNKRIAYPVRLDKIEKAGIEEFSEIFQSNLDDSLKVIYLNKFLAERGVDVSLPGNSFVAVGDNTNLNQEFFSDKLAQLESISYFSNLDTWVDNKIPVSSILESGVSVDIDLHNPFHSPKVQLDYSKLDIDINVTSVKGVETDEVVSEGASALKKIINDSGNKTEAEDIIDKDC